MVEHLEDVLIVRIDEPLFFANTGKLNNPLFLFKKEKEYYRQ
jgi:MFS superfamily sulfate permease-like transporter